ncbi:MAG: hypothetical protein R3B40_08700 [Polyangiales bacterium]|nr:hypothetical protein [Myxococcales bacterium]MCB9656315.1 hypothetical protein [Sandaracinaceae bacterium]
MAIAIVPHSVERKPLVEAFNAELRAAQSPWGFYVDPVPAWIPKQRDDQPVWRELHLAVERGAGAQGTEGAPEERCVGAYGLKPQVWRVHGQEHVVADWQGPVSLGAIDNRYAALGLRLLRDMKKKQPHLYSWGHGGGDEPIVQLLTKMGWMLYDTPFVFRVCHAGNFLRKNAYLRRDPRRALAQDALAATGLGAVGFSLLHGGLRARSRKRFTAEAQVVPSFGPWADALWERAKDRYAAIAVRDASAMNTLVPSEHHTLEWPAPTRLRVVRGGETLGWAVVVHKRLEGDARFGDLHVGQVADCFGLPEHAGEVLHAAFTHLRGLGVDLVTANQSHPGWVASYADNGFVVMPKRRLFCASPELQALLQPFEQTRRGLFLTNFDGHGPML